MSLRSLTLTFIAALAANASAHASTFNLATAIGDTPTFSVVSGGVTATFTSPAGNSFLVQDTTGLFSFNTAVVDNSFGTDPLTITFSSPIGGSILVPFGFIESGNTTDSITMTASNGQTATFLGTPDSLILAEPEGVASLALRSQITSITLTSPEAISVGSPSAVPEPSSLALLATGLGSLSGMVLRRRRSR